MIIAPVSVVCVLSLLSLRAFAGEKSQDHRKVTCGSGIKLTHVSTGFKLHSHEVKYGSGSGQQSITAFPNADDPNSLFMIYEGFKHKPCSRGDPIPCDSVVRLRHITTEMYLHSHLHTSPMSGQQEVSGFSEQNADDNWRVKCVTPATGVWTRDAEVRLQHVSTGRYLSTAKEYMYRNPIPGQLEVSASSTAGKNTLWQAAQGIYFSDNPTMS